MAVGGIVAIFIDCNVVLPYVDRVASGEDFRIDAEGFEAFDGLEEFAAFGA
jgi:hypothetical protein